MDEIKYEDKAVPKRFGGVPVFTVILIAALSVITAGYAVSGPYYGTLGLILAASFTAFLVRITNSRLTLLLPLVGAVCGAVIFRQPPVWPLAAISTGYFMATSSLGKMRKNTAFICSSAFALAAALLHFTALAAIGGDLSVSGITAEIVRPYTEFKAVYAEYSAYLAEYGMVIDESALRTFKNEFIRSSPALAIDAVLIVTWLSYLGMTVLSRFFTADMPVHGRGFSMSMISAYVFTAAYFVAIISGIDGGGAVSTAASNIVSVLVPGFTAVGFTGFLRRVKRKTRGGFLYAAYIVLSVLLIMSSLGTVTVVYIFAGVVYTFYSGFREKRKNS